MTVADQPRESPAFTAARHAFELSLERTQREGGTDAAQALIDEWHRSHRRRSAMTSPTVAPEVSRGKSNGKSPATQTEAGPVGPSFEQIRVDQVDVGDNVRIQPAEIEEMAASILEHGVISPVKVVGPHTDGRYRLVYGQRRLLGARAAGLLLIPAIVVGVGADVDEPGAKRSIEQLVENLVRADLNPIDEAKALRAVLDADPELTQAKLARELGRSDSWLSNTLRVLDTAPEVQQLLVAGKLTVGHVKALASLDVDLQAGLAQRAASGSWSAHDVERNAKWERDNAAATRKRRAAAEKHVQAAIEQLEKVTDRKSATIAIADYYTGTESAKALTADGWAVEANGHNVETVANAGECGCKGAWRIEIPYSESAKVKVSPACISADHRAERQKVQDAKWAAQRKADDARREKERLDAVGRAARVADGLEAEIDTAFGKRVLIQLLVADGDLDDNLLDQYMNGEKADVEDTADDDNDDVWAVIERIPEGELNKVIARAAAEMLDDQWRVGQSLRAAIAAKWPAPPVEPLVKTKKKAATA